MDKMDILNRDEFVEQLIRLVKNISDNKGSTCFAINGIWGSGKSFVLDMFEQKLSQIQSEKTFNEKYFIVRYNSWKYDYYEEPLIAIVSAIIAEIEEKTKIVPDSEKKSKILGMLKSTSEALLSVANDMVKAKIGIDVHNGFNILFKGRKEGEEEYNKKHIYDKYFQLNRVIDKLAASLQKIAEEYTVVIIVDELDRCLPEYAIKVLERLHHLTEEKRNIITIIAIDKKQFEISIEKIFGFNNPEKYLEKFINFEITLSKGNVSEKITEKYADYLKLFDKEIIAFEEPIEECMQEIFKKIDARTQEQIMKKTMLAHKILFSNMKDYSFMCTELIISVMFYAYKYRAFIGGNQINMNTFDSVFVQFSNSVRPSFVEYFSGKFNEIKFDKNMSKYANEPSDYIFPEMLSLPSAILFTWYYVHNKHGGSIHLKYTKGGVYEPLVDNVKELKRFIEILQIIK